MSDAVLEKLRSIIQQDLNRRGLATDPKQNLFTECAGDFAAACRSLAEASSLDVGLVTGFYIPPARAYETDGPLGTVALARLLNQLEASVTVFTEKGCAEAVWHALEYFDLAQHIGLVALPATNRPDWVRKYGDPAEREGLTHVIFVERVGPAYLGDNIPPESRDQCHTMGGRIITSATFPVHLWIDRMNKTQRITTIGIGDGGNEIGMGKIPYEVIASNVPNGGQVACRVATDYNIVCGVSNWGAYALGAGVWCLRGMPYDAELFDTKAEREAWETVLQETVLVDGVTGKRTLTVDGLEWREYARPLDEIAKVLRSCSSS